MKFICIIGAFYWFAMAACVAFGYEIETILIVISCFMTGIGFSSMSKHV